MWVFWGRVEIGNCPLFLGNRKGCPYEVGWIFRMGRPSDLRINRMPRFVFMGGYMFEFFLSECHAVVTAAHAILDKGYRGCFIPKMDSRVVKLAS